MYVDCVNASKFCTSNSISIHIFRELRQIKSNENGIGEEMLFKWNTFIFFNCESLSSFSLLT